MEQCTGTRNGNLLYIQDTVAGSVWVNYVLEDIN